jgi:hypothetical protein
MYPYETPPSKASGARTGHVFDTIANCGRLAPQMLAAEETHRDAAHQAALWRATHPADDRKPGRLRAWFGTLLIRLGTRVQGVPSAASTELSQAIPGS